MVEDVVQVQKLGVAEVDAMMAANSRTTLKRYVFALIDDSILVVGDDHTSGGASFVKTVCRLTILFFLR